VTLLRDLQQDARSGTFPASTVLRRAQTLSVRLQHGRSRSAATNWDHGPDRRSDPLHVLVTRNGKPAAALVPIDEYEALEETAEILSDSETLAAIEAGLAELARGDSVTLDDLRRDLAERRAVR
jgi:antitoxin YefM